MSAPPSSLAAADRNIETAMKELDEVMMKHIKVEFTEYELKFAKEYSEKIGHEHLSVMDMRISKQYEEDQKLDPSYPHKQFEDQGDNHPLHCGCDTCESFVFAEREVDEDHDNGEGVRKEWKEKVHQARIDEAISKIETSERWIRNYIDRDHQFRLNGKRQREILEERKRTYVHVKGTSKWLEYGHVSDCKEQELFKLKEVKKVDTVTDKDTGVITCRLHIQWPIVSSDLVKLDAHYREVLSMSGFRECTPQNVKLVTWEDPKEAKKGEMKREPEIICPVCNKQHGNLGHFYPGLVSSCCWVCCGNSLQCNICNPEKEEEVKKEEAKNDDSGKKVCPLCEMKFDGLAHMNGQSCCWGCCSGAWNCYACNPIDIDEEEEHRKPFIKKEKEEEEMKKESEEEKWKRQVESQKKE